MKKLLPFLGVLFVAQLLFVGLIHVFLVLQDKSSPQTLRALSELPVIGGFFPRPPLPDEPATAGDLQDQDMKRMLLEGDELFVLPREIPAEEVHALIASTRRARERFEEMAAELESEREALEIRKSQVKGDQEELVRRIERLAELEREIDARWEELQAKERTVTEGESQAFARLGEIYSKMPPERVADILQRMKPADAARLMATIEARNQGKIFSAMDMGAQIDIQKHLLGRKE